MAYGAHAHPGPKLRIRLELPERPAGDRGELGRRRIRLDVARLRRRGSRRDRLERRTQVAQEPGFGDRPPERAFDPERQRRLRLEGRFDCLLEQPFAADAVKRAALIGEARAPVEQGQRFLRPVGGQGALRDTVLGHGPARAPRGARGARRLEKLRTGLALEHRPAPQFALLDLAQATRGARIVELGPHLPLLQPAAEIAHPRSRPDLAPGFAVSALDGVEQRRRELGARREDGTAGIRRLDQAGYHTRRRLLA
jgi:hypothetical protein